MEIEDESLDAVLLALYKALLQSSGRNTGTRGSTIEMLGVALRITKPRARLSRSENRGKPFSALGELLWYLSKSDRLEFIEPYVRRYRDDAVGGILHGAYGPRIFAMRGNIDQMQNVTDLLHKHPGSRRAVIQIFNAEDIVTRYPEVPCTTTLQFFVRGDYLHLSVTMRSNDAYFGLPHDVFCFTMLQEMMACRLGVELGEYYHYAGSMHVYENKISEIKEYISEGHQKPVEMPVMPVGDPFQLAPRLLEVENRVRSGERVVASEVFKDAYWADIVRLIQVFWVTGRSQQLDDQQLDKLKAEFSNPIYRSYLEERRHMKPRASRSQSESGQA